MCRSTDDPNDRDHAGRPIDGVEVRIVDADGASSRVHRRGLIRATSSWLATSATRQPPPRVDEEGWLPPRRRTWTAPATWRSPTA